MTIAQHPNNQQSSEQHATTTYPKTQRALLAACILLAPLSITLYLIAWHGSGRDAVATAAAAGSTGNTLRLVGAVAASFFLPLGYLAMSLLGTRRAPNLAFICAALSLIGWIPWAALIVLDDMAVTIHQTGGAAQLEALWTRMNGDPVLTTFLLIYIIGHLLSAILIGVMLGRLHIIPAWAAWAFALTSPLTITLILIHNAAVQDVLKYAICVLWIVGAIPAAIAMLKGKN